MLSFISEVTSIQQLKILKESKVDRGWKVEFEACLQTADERNNNNRVYRREHLSEAVNKVTPRIQNRAFVGELDHPLSEDMKRQVMVMYQECSHVITKTWWSGKELMGKLETLGTPNGKILTELIKDKIRVGFSVRALGNMEKRDNIEYILSPIYIVSYDAVSDPSHAEATIRNFSECKTRICFGDICFDVGNAESAMDFYADEALKQYSVIKENARRIKLRK
jgi:CRISPR/Cas system-associated endoribonuclease Cas2